MDSIKIDSLYFFIAKPKEIDEFTRKVLTYIIEFSNGMSKPGCITIPSSEDFDTMLVKKIAEDCQTMFSAAGHSINMLLQAMGTDMRFAVRSGRYDHDAGSFNSRSLPYAITIWLAYVDREDEAYRLTFNREEILAVTLGPKLELV